MTYVLAWKSKQSIFISADSVVTMVGCQPNKPFEFSSFGEKLKYDNEVSVQEGAFKIVNIKDRYLASFATDNAELAYALIGVFNNEVGRPIKRTNIKLLSDVIAQQAEELDGYKLQLVIGVIEDSGPILMHFDNLTGNHVIRSDETIVHLGSLTGRPALIERVHSVVVGIANGSFGLNPESYGLMAVNAIIQYFGIRDPSIEIGVGGFIAGAQLDKDGVRWQQDTTYFIIGGKPLESCKIVNVSYRLNSIVVSPNVGSARSFLSFFDPPFNNLDDLRKLHHPRKSLESAYYVFLSINRDQLIAMPRSEYQKGAFHLEGVPEEPNAIDLILSEQILYELEHGPDGPLFYR